MWRAIARTSLGVLILTGGGAASATPAVSQPNSLRVVDEQGASAPTVGGEAPAAAADDDPPAEFVAGDQGE